jgi:hypothetical protein
MVSYIYTHTCVWYIYTHKPILCVVRRGQGKQASISPLIQGLTRSLIPWLIPRLIPRLRCSLIPRKSAQRFGAILLYEIAHNLHIFFSSGHWKKDSRSWTIVQKNSHLFSLNYNCDKNIKWFFYYRTEYWAGQRNSPFLTRNANRSPLFGLPEPQNST